MADNAIDADEVVNVTLSTSSNDAVYANLADTVVEVTNTNVDQAGLVLIQSDGLLKSQSEKKALPNPSTQSASRYLANRLMTCESKRLAIAKMSLLC